MSLQMHGFTLTTLVALFACSPAAVTHEDPAPDDKTDAGTVAGANSGAPCTSASACAGTTPTCLATDASGAVHPGGYCSSACDPSRNEEFTGSNRDCPGRNTCVLADGQAICRASCTDRFGDQPCRDGYVCAFSAAVPGGAPACFPATAFCDPASATSCGGGKVCLATSGVDGVGACVTSCDPLLQNCAAGEGCYAQENGTGVCLRAGDVGDGMPCDYGSQCAPGLGCRVIRGFTKCQRYCGGPNNVACLNERPCVGLTPDVSKDVLGQCE